MITLNPYQEAAANHKDGPCLVTSVPGSGKCISHDSHIFSSTEKLSFIKDNAVKNVYSTNSEDLYQPSIVEREIEKFHDEGFRDTIKISVSGGFSIEGTHNHKIAVLAENGRFVWKPLSQITVNDICPIYIDRGYTPGGFDPWFYLAGLLIGDGGFSQRTCVINFTQQNDCINCDNHISELYCRYMKQYTGKDVNIGHDKRSISLFNYKTSSCRIRKLFTDSFGDFDRISSEKILTSKILSSNFTQISSLLRGIFDTDGYVDKNGSCLGLTLSSEILINQIHNLLLMFGVFSTKSIRLIKNKKYYNINISGPDRNRFLYNINMNHDVKKNRLRNGILNSNKNYNRTFSGLRFILVGLKEYICEKQICNYKNTKLNGKISYATISYKNEEFSFHRYILQSKNARSLTENSLKKLLKITDAHNVRNVYTDFLHTIINKYQFCNVQNISYGKSHVYDYVIPKSHSFIANGFINHNTAMLVERTARLINSGVIPKSIVCMTFTNKAADEMKERIAKRLGLEKPGLWVGTFHALCALLLRKFGSNIGLSGRFTILDSNDQKDLMLKCSRQLGFDLEKNEILSVVKSVNDYRENLHTHEHMEFSLNDREDYIRLADEYIDRLRRSDCVDFSGLLSESIRLLKESKPTLDTIQDAFKYLQVDEFQDTNKSQFELINLFSGKWNNILGVGDLSQSIYRFRGARYQNIHDFISRHKDCKVLELSLNYRSTPEIIDVADKLIRHNKSHMSKEFKTNNSTGNSPICVRLQDQMEEAEWVSRHISRLVNEGGWSYSDIAVLYRMNSMAEPIERSLTNNRMEYVVIGGRSFYDRREVKDCLAILKFLINPKDSIAFERLSSFIAGLGNVTIGKIENIADESSIGIMDAFEKFLQKSGSQQLRTAHDLVKDSFDIGNIDEHNAATALDTVIGKLKYFDFLEKEYKEDFQDRIDNVRSMITAAGEFSDGANGYAAMQNYLQMVSLITSSDKKKDGNRISLMTLHASKGQEFPVVFIVGVEHGILPHGMSLSEDIATKTTEGIEEERRLFYVGVTRAEKALFTSYCKRRKFFSKNGSNLKAVRPSQFLFESGLAKSNEKERINYGESASYTSI